MLELPKDDSKREGGGEREGAELKTQALRLVKERRGGGGETAKERGKSNREGERKRKSERGREKEKRKGVIDETSEVCRIETHFEWQISRYFISIDISIVRIVFSIFSCHIAFRPEKYSFF